MSSPLTHLQVLIDMLDDAFLRATRGGRFIGCNDAACRMLGYTREELTLLTREDLAIPQDPRFREVVATREERGAVRGVVELRKKGGEPFTVEVASVDVAFGEDEEEVWIVLHDLSERRRADEATAAQRESNDLLRALTDAAFEAILVHRDGKVLLANRAAEVAAGVASGELAGKHLFDFIAPVSHDLSRSKVAGGDEEPYEAFGRRADGTIYPLEVRVRNAPLQVAGKPARVVALRDLTARRLVEEELRVSEERWRRISEATFEGIVFSQGGVIVDANRQIADLLGYDPVELVGKPVAECIAPEHRDLVAKAIEEGRTTAYEHQLLRKDGTRVLVETRARTLHQGGQTVRVTAVHDVSERARLESELRRRERFATVGAVVGSVAHEVRNPLFAISAALDVLGLQPLSAESEQALLEQLRSQVSRLSLLMEDLLEYGRPRGLRLQPTVAATTVEQAVRQCQALAARLGVQIDVRVAEDLPSLELDGDRVVQVLENLITNALQHAPADSRVLVSAELSERASSLALRVEDEGPGVSEADLDRVFEPFFSRRRGGTGLGLAIAQQFVEAHGGTIEARNRHGRGAAFTVFLPVAGPGKGP
jgi:PAS domain S-box-containing protein